MASGFPCKNHQGLKEMNRQNQKHASQNASTGKKTLYKTSEQKNSYRSTKFQI
jgi:hypothetical protein